MISVRQETVEVDAATHIAAHGFVQQLSPALRADVAGHLAEGQLVYGIREGQELVGFSIFNRFGQVLYLAGIILLPKVQARGVANFAIEVARHDTGAQFLALRTQSPRMWSVGNKLCADWYPDREGCSRDESFAARLRAIADRIRMREPIQAGFYGGPLYGQKQTHADPELQAWWDQLCDFERGDAVLCLGRFKGERRVE